MPLNPSALTPLIAVNLISTLQIGTGMPKLALGIATGVCTFFGTFAKVTSIDTGSLGAGNTTAPLIVPPPLLYSSILVGYASMGILGPMAPLNALGVANGIAAGLAALAIVQVVHPGIGLGTGLMRVVGSSAVPAMIAGFATVQMVNDGSIKLASAIGIGLDIVFQSFVMPIPIVGSASPAGGAGVGFGFVI
jgi:hypothetical protein